MMKKKDLVALILVILFDYVRGDLGGCDGGWVASDTYCYYFNNATTVTQQQATNECSLRFAHLLRIENVEELHFVAKFAAYYPSLNGFWTSLNSLTTDSAGKGVWLWGSNEYPSNQVVNWTQKANKVLGKGHCGVFLMKGMFADRNCTDRNNYICRKDQIHTLHPVNFGCGEWTRAGHKCYLFFDQPANWSQAQTYCQGMGGNLMQIESKDDTYWLSIMSRTAQVAWGGYWIGLRTTDHNTWTWTDGSQADPSLLTWNSEPNNFNGLEDCAAMMSDGVFTDRPCTSSKLGFICEKDASGFTCQPNWILWGSECYFFGRTWVTWTEALDQCKSLSADGTGYLFGLDSQQEKTWILQQISTFTKAPFEFWSSLTDIEVEGVWLYQRPVNNKPNMNFIEWNKEPNNYRNQENCVNTVYSGRLNDFNCQNAIGFICERLADGFYNKSNSVSRNKGNSLMQVIIFSLLALFVASMATNKYC